MTSSSLAALYVYPVKSLAGLSRAEAFVEPWGLAGDRRWMLTDADGIQLTQRDHPQLALVSVEPLPDGGIVLHAPGMPPAHTPVPPPSTGTRAVTLFRTKVEVVPAVGEVGDWFSAYLGTPAQLVHLDDPAVRRPVNPDFSRPGDMVSFADGYPLLLTTVSSLDALNSLIAQGDHFDEGPLPMNRFRPSVVVAGTAPWAEDDWRRVRIGEVTFRVTRPCGRCVITTTDQTTGERGKEPLRTLARHRRFGDQLVFGQNLIPERTGRVRSGDSFEVLDALG